MLPGEFGSVNVDMAGRGSAELAGEWYRSTMRYNGFCGWAKGREGGSGEYVTWGRRRVSEG